MRASPLSLAAESVFQYDLQQELEIDLNRLRKKACEDGDVVLILPDHTCIWVHSPLFYAASKKLPTEFGTVTGKSLNDWGVTVTFLSVPEKNRLRVEEVMEACYTQGTLLLLWEAMGGDNAYLNSRHGQIGSDISLVNSTLPASMLPDFEINLRETDDGKFDGPSQFSIKVHRFLLDARVDYYQAKTRSGLKFKDTTPMSSNLSRTVFTDLSLWAITMYVYRGVPSVILNIDPNFEEYITEQTIRDSHLNKGLSCSEFRIKCRLPAEGIENLLLEISRAANFLLIPQLENWAHFQLYRLAHRFQCTGSGCAEIIPFIIEAVYWSDITDEWMFNTGISWLARYENIPSLWKWSLLYKPRVIALLIEKIKEPSIEGDGENDFPRGESAIELFLRLWKLKQYTSMTKDSEKWDKDLIQPLMEHSTEVVLRDLRSSVTFTRLSSLVYGRSFLKLAGEDLLHRVVEKVSTNETQVKDWVYIEKLVKLSVKKDLPPKVSRLKRDTIMVKITPQLTEEKVLHPENQIVIGKENVTKASGTTNIEGHGSIGKKRVDSRLKGSATPFVPRGIYTPLKKLENIQRQANCSITSLPGNKHGSPGKPSTEDQKCEISGLAGLEGPLPCPDPEKLSKETVTHARHQGSKTRRTISAPALKGNEMRKTWTANRGNENRRFTSPTIGGAIPFSQQMKMTSFYDNR